MILLTTTWKLIFEPVRQREAKDSTVQPGGDATAESDCQTPEREEAPNPNDPAVGDERPQRSR
jgi:hypothetical protein